jgi:hypothetical protein
MILALALACIDNSFTKPSDGDGPVRDSSVNDCPPSLPNCDSGLPEDTQDSAEVVEPETCGDDYTPGGTLSLVDECYVEVSTGTFTPVVEWTKSSWATDPSSNNIMMMPAVASLNDDDGDGDVDTDDYPDVIVVTYGGTGTLRAISGKDGTSLWDVTNQSLQGQGAVAVGDIDNDGLVEIVACTSSAVKAFENDGTLKWTSASISGHLVGTSDAPAIADMDGDGDPEIIVGRAILDNNGSILGTGSAGMGTTSNVGTTSFAADLDGDGLQEVVVGNALYNMDGSTQWTNGQSDGYVGVGDMDGDGEPDIVVTGDAQVRIQDRLGNVMCSNSIPGANSSAGGPHTIADFDGDGEAEFGVAATSTYTVFESDCSQLWQKATQDASSGNTGSAVFDFEGDGIAEVVYADETRIWVLAGPDGSVKLESTDHTNNTWTEYAVIADIDNDGTAEIVVPNTGTRTGITVIGDADSSWRPGRKIWNQHAYSITNVEDDGSIPRTPDANWKSYNNFRSGDLTAGSGGAWPDLVVQIAAVCEDECDRGRFFATLQVGNQGHTDITDPVEVLLYAVTPDGTKQIASTVITSPIAAGELLEGVEVEISGIDEWIIYDLLVTVDESEAHEECDEDNNLGSWGWNVCQG